MLGFSPPKVNKQAVLRGEWGPRTLFESRKVAGSATFKQSENIIYCVIF